MSLYNIVAATDDCTVVTEYKPQATRSEAYQTEAELEAAFIKMLTQQGYTYLNIHREQDLIDNLRLQLEKLNHYQFTDDEWDSFFHQVIANKNEGIVEKTRKIQEDNIQILTRKDGSFKNITLIDKKNPHNNSLQVINQYTEDRGNYENRYDVTILVNGFPLVHVELKRRGKAIREAFNQIDRYQRDSFWAGSGLYEYVQIFVISNGTNTKYYSNSTRFAAIKERQNGKSSRKKTSNSFEFTSFWADVKNQPITDLVDFTHTFFAKHTILNILTKYCVLTVDNLLLVMRPYQIAATEKVMQRILIANNYKLYGSVDGGGYVWHSTGAGKTLESFKVAQLASQMDDVDLVLFVVDRKDLDYQTIREYDRFEKGAANGNRNTKVLQRQLEGKDEKGNPHQYKIIVTTIQKLDIFIKRNPNHPVYQKRVVIIMDECHRSQFGSMHEGVTRAFKKYSLFGFTGTPIFATNAPSPNGKRIITTQQAFGDCLHSYTIVDGINDGNVLPFRIDYVDTMKVKDGGRDSKVQAIDTESALLAPQRISEIVTYILDHFNQKTMRQGEHYAFKRLINIEASSKDPNAEKQYATVNMRGFNSILAVSSITAAKLYYEEFKHQMEARGEKLNIALIYSFGPNEEDPNGFLQDEDSDDTEALDTPSRDFLERAIQDYNNMFGTAYDTSAEKFGNYYKDLSLRMKNREVDLLIVVNMFLTGFDATTLNTLWVDKYLRQHGLIQAFSRTNRILNSVKTYGNIVCFRNLQKEVEEALALFGDTSAKGIVLLKSYEDYYYGYDEGTGKHHKGFTELVGELKAEYPIGKQLVGETAVKGFVGLMGNILKLNNILTSFDQYDPSAVISPRDFQDYVGMYIDLHDQMVGKGKAEQESILDDVVFELDLVKQVEVNIDYILKLIEEYHDSFCQNKEIVGAIERAVKSSIELRSKKDLIFQFVHSMNSGTVADVGKNWLEFVREQREKDLVQLIADERLKEAETRKLVDNMLRENVLKTAGTDIDEIMPPVSRFGKSNRSEKKQTIIEKLQKYLEKYGGLER